MNAVLWIAAALLALIFLAAGADKLLTSFETLRSRRPWARDFGPAQVRLLGALEVLGAIGLIAPAVTGILPGLVALAAACLAALMLVVLSVQVRRHEPLAGFVVPVVSLALAAAVAVGRAGSYHF
jgi:hypothetical protein